MRPIEESCFWLATREKHALKPALSGEVSTEIAIVGAGFTGLWTALFLTELEPQLDVVVVEQGEAGYGASGRNAGIVGASIDHSHALAIAHFGEEEAAMLARLGMQNLDELSSFAQGCDFLRSGQLHVALVPAHLEAFAENLEVARRLGIDGYRLLSAEEARAELNSPLYLGALIDPHGGTINPIKLVDKLRRELALRGVRIFERTRVEAVTSDDRAAKLATAQGSVTARRVVMATDAYTHHLFPRLLHRYIPLYDYIVVSEPLLAAQKAALGWANRRGVTDGRTFFNYYRLTADDRVLFGTSEAHYFPPNRVEASCDHSETHYAALRDSFFRHFPALAGLKFPYAWGGPIASTTRLTPFFGSLHDGRVLYGLGYTGHGIGSTRVAGQILARLALSRSSELLQLGLVQKPPFPYPPEPLRSWAVRSVTESLRRVDRGLPPSLLLRALDGLGLGFSS